MGAGDRVRTQVPPILWLCSYMVDTGTTLTQCSSSTLIRRVSVGWKALPSPTVVARPARWPPFQGTEGSCSPRSEPL